MSNRNNRRIYQQPLSCQDSNDKEQKTGSINTLKKIEQDYKQIGDLPPCDQTTNIEYVKKFIYDKYAHYNNY